MQSEIENITKGSVVSTPEFDMSKKVIGISTSNLVPDATGYSPLGSQKAFIQPQAQVQPAPVVQTPQVAQTSEVAASQAVPVTPLVPTTPTAVPADSLASVQPVVENPLTSQQQTPVSDGVTMDWNDFFNKGSDDTVPATELPAVGALPSSPQQDVILDNPIEVGNIASMNNLSSSGLQPSDLIKPVVDSSIPVPETTPPAVEMPAMPTEVVPGEPMVTNDSLFSEPVAELNPSVPSVNPTVEEVVNPIAGEEKNDLKSNTGIDYKKLLEALDKLIVACNDIKDVLSASMNKEVVNEMATSAPLPDNQQPMESLDTILSR